MAHKAKVRPSWKLYTKNVQPNGNYHRVKGYWVPKKIFVGTEKVIDGH